MSFSIKTILLLSTLLLSLSGCGYRFLQQSPEASATLCIPYVEGDERGELTSALIYAVTSRSHFIYKNKGAACILRVCLSEPEDRTIGFTYGSKKKRRDSNILVSNEARLILTAHVRLIDACTRQDLLAPMEISASLDYDFEPDLSTIQAHAFSLGQLEMHHLAQDAAFPSLYRLLAEKIVDYVNSAWYSASA